MTTGTLFVVATPIGNLSDASPRCLETLRSADIVACEDTRTTRTLLARHGIEARTVALHEHNERDAAIRLLEALLAGTTVALVSDAGTPAVSDPGAYLVAQAHKAGVRVSPIPGPSAALAAFSAAGFGGDRYLFAGFLPAAAAARRKALQELDLPYPVILYEAPHRIMHAVQDLLEQFGPDREIVIGRELTKKFEELVRMRLADAPGWLEAPHRTQGEFVVVIAAGAPKARGAEIRPGELLDALLEALAPSDAARIAARITGLPRRALYQQALERAK